jgi:hypothetical protein
MVDFRPDHFISEEEPQSPFDMSADPRRCVDVAVKEKTLPLPYLTLVIQAIVSVFSD